MRGTIRAELSPLCTYERLLGHAEYGMKPVFDPPTGLFVVAGRHRAREFELESQEFSPCKREALFPLGWLRACPRTRGGLEKGRRRTDGVYETEALKQSLMFSSVQFHVKPA